MRNPKRIPIALDLMLNKETLLHFLNTSSQKLVDNIYDNWKEIEETWLKYPDLRFGQLLCNLRLIPNIDIENYIWNIEENKWLLDNYYIEFENIKFWGVNYYKNGKKRKKTKHVLLKDLELDHIKNIIKFFEKYNAINTLPKDYLEYFNERMGNE